MTQAHGADWRAYMAEHYDDLRRTCRRMTGDDERADEVMSDVVVDVLPRILERYDGEKEGACPLRQWVNRNVRWYVYKWLLAEDKRKAQTISMAAAEVSCNIDAGLMYRDDECPRREDVEFGRAVYAAMDQGDRDLCVMRYVMDLTIREIAERCSWSVGYAHLRITNATEAMAETAERLLRKKQ